VTESGHSSPSVQPQLECRVNGGGRGTGHTYTGLLQGRQEVVEVARLVGPRSSAGALKFQPTMLLEWLDTTDPVSSVADDTAVMQNLAEPLARAWSRRPARGWHDSRPGQTATRLRHRRRSGLLSSISRDARSFPRMGFGDSTPDERPVSESYRPTNNTADSATQAEDITGASSINSSGSNAAAGPSSVVTQLQLITRRLARYLWGLTPCSAAARSGKHQELCQSRVA
jgi:hypothetical protein